MLALATVLASALLALPQDKPAEKAIPATAIKPAAAAQAAPAAPVNKLGVGDPAPALAYDEWIKGDKIDGIAKGKVHVIEFWATWCGPCIAAMPHLTELQKKHPEVVVVSCAASERGKDEAAKIAKVKEFVSAKGDGMGYRVVYAGDREKMSKPWMQAAGQNGIPCAFIVDKNATVAWIGHPMQMDEPLDKILAGKWDVAAAKKEFDAEREAEEAQMKLMVMMREASSTGDYSKAIDAMKAQLAKSPNDAMKMQLFTILAGPADRAAEAWKIGEEIFDANKSNGMMMNQLAWTIVDPDGGVKTPNLDLAMKAAEACAKADAKNGAYLDTMARVVFLKGDVARAIELQKKAVELSSDGRMKDEMKQTLASYEGALKKA
jgi:thiol-disulfide isomerase/thioredoxin